MKHCILGGCVFGRFRSCSLELLTNSEYFLILLAAVMAPVLDGFISVSTSSLWAVVLGGVGHSFSDFLVIFWSVTSLLIEAGE